MWILRVRPTQVAVLSSLSFIMLLVSVVFGVVKAYFLFSSNFVSLYPLGHYLILSCFFVCSISYGLFMTKATIGAASKPHNQPGYKRLPSLWEEHEESQSGSSAPSLSINDSSGLVEVKKGGEGAEKVNFFFRSRLSNVCF